MAELASLGLSVDSAQVKSGTMALTQLTGAAGTAEQAVRGLGTASTSEANGQKQATAATLAHTAAIQTQNTALQRASGAMRANTGNIAAQLQDIAVTSQMGMSAMTIGLQQGTQLASVIGSMENPIKGLGAAFLSLISPVSIVVIGLTALLAVGLQIIDWEGVVKAVLYGIANGLEAIAPYAVAAAIALALLYSPAIIGGLFSAIAGIGSLATAVWGLAAAIYATVGLPALLIAGFLLLAAAAVLWRDDLTKMLGVDIVGAAQSGINWIIGAFVGGFEGIKAAWSLLPVAVGDVAIQMAQAYLNAEIDMLNKAKNAIIAFVNWSASLTSMIPGVGPINSLISGALEKGVPDIPKAELPNPFAGSASSVGGTVGDAVSHAQGVDYLGKGIGFVQNAASGAADALRGFAGSVDFSGKASGKAAKEAKRQAEAYADIVRGAQQRIDQSHLEVESLGMTAQETARLRYEQELLNKAANDNIALTPKQTEQLSALATGMAAAEEGARKAKDAFSFAKDSVKGFLSDLRSGLADGKGFWEAFGDAANNVLDKIISKVEDELVDALFSMGSGGGGGLGSIFGAIGSLFGFANGGVFNSGHQVQAFASGGIVSKPTVFPMANGMGLMGEAGPEAIMPLRRGPDGRLGVSAANQNGGSQQVHVTVGVAADGNGNILPFVQSVSQQTVAQAAPSIVGVATQQSNKSAPAAMARYQSQQAGSDYRLG